MEHFTHNVLPIWWNVSPWYAWQSLWLVEHCIEARSDLVVCVSLCKNSFYHCATILSCSLSRCMLACVCAYEHAPDKYDFQSTCYFWHNISCLAWRQLTQFRCSFPTESNSKVPCERARCQCEWQKHSKYMSIDLLCVCVCCVCVPKHVCINISGKQSLT